MKDWLSKLHELFLDGQPFVVATTYAYHGNSPETPGVSLFHSGKKTYRFTSSDFRYQALRTTADNMLVSPVCYQIEKLSLGKIAGLDNGHCEIIYEYFDARQYPEWLRELRTYSHAGVSSTLLREFDASNNGNVTRTSVFCEAGGNNADPMPQRAGLTCWMQQNNKSHQLFRTIQNNALVVALIGNHPVADEIQKQCIHLPIETLRLSGSEAHLSEQNIVIIMTSDHELDYQFCEALLSEPNRDENFFIGCIGSEKKAQIFIDRLLQSGINKSQLSQLHMPVGLTEITGKQNAVIAASIVAQIMTLHSW